MARKIKALIVDDSLVSRRSVIRLIEETALADFSFVEAEDGLQALDKYAENQFDVLFVDMHMPRMDGMQFLKRLHATYTTCPPAVLVTADENRDRLIAMVNEAHICAVMMKPVDAKRMYQGLKKLLATIPDRTSVWTVPHAECIGEALISVTQQLCGVDLEQIDVSSATELRDAVFCMIYLSGSIDWAMTIGFNKSAAEHITSCLAQERLEFHSPDLLDAIAEVANTFAGQLKRLLLDRELMVDYSLPTVISAEGLRFHSPAGETKASDKICFTGRNSDTDPSDSGQYGLIWVGVNAGTQSSLMF